MLLLSFAVINLIAIARLVHAASWIEPGAVWYDTDGKKIDAHGGSILQKDETFYWIGYSIAQSRKNSPNTPDATFYMPPTDISNRVDETPVIYSSNDLLNWKYLGSQAPSVTGMWRPKLAIPNNSSFWVCQTRDAVALRGNVNHTASLDIWPARSICPFSSVV